MKKFFFAITLVFLIPSVLFAASDDVYLRKDVFDAKMEAFFERIDNRFDKLETKIDKNYAELDAKIDKNYAELNAKIDKNYSELNSKIDQKYAELETKIDKNYIDLNVKIDKNYAELSGRMDRLEGKMEGFEYKLEAVNDTIAFRLSILTLAVAIVGLFFAFFTWKNNSTSNITSTSLTREDVVKIFEQLIDAKLQNFTQAHVAEASTEQVTVGR